MKKAISLIIVMLAIFTLAACQATPDEEFIVKKDTERMVEQAGAQDGGTAISSLEIPDGKYAFEAAGTNGKIQIKADADIILPETDYMPVARIGRGQFTDSDVKNLYDALCADKTPLSDNSQLPKDYYRVQLEQLTQMRQSGNLDKYESMVELDEAINELMRKIESAPETVDGGDLDLSFVAKDGGASEVDALCIDSDAVVSQLIVTNQLDGNGGGTAEYIRDVQERQALSLLTAPGLTATLAFAETTKSDFIPPEINKAQAQETAQSIIAKLGLKDFSCTGTRLMPIEGASSGAYEFMFTRSVNGVSITYTNEDMSADMEESNSVAKPWMYEKIRIFIDDGGVFALIWNAPYVVEEIQYEKATLLSFEKIKSTFEQMIVVKSEQFGEAGLTGEQAVNVTEVRLGLMRVIEKDHNANAVLVPVWDFFGTRDMNDGGTVIGMDGYQSLLTINAVDGSIVDRSLGY